MARIDKSALTRLEIMQEATKQFLEKGYTSTTVGAICKELGMSTGNLTFHFPTKEHLLAVLVDMLCDFQWKMIEEKANDGVSSIMAICLELTSMASVCEQDQVIKDFFLSSYSSPICLDIIRRNDTARAKEVFGQYRPDWSHEQFMEAEVLVSGIEYATLMTTDETLPLETRISGAVSSILSIYGIPEETRKVKLEKVFAMDYKNIGMQILTEFKQFVEQSNVDAFVTLVKQK